MKALTTLILLCLAAFIAWPYTALYRLNEALASDRDQELAQIVNLDQVRTQIKTDFNQSVQNTMGSQQNAFLSWLQDGVRRLGGDAVDQMIDLEWVRDTLLSKSRTGQDTPASFLRHVDFAFFEWWNRFVVRLGPLGQDPVFVVLSLEDYEWKVSALYP
jgi:hypothetical protein